MAFVPEGQHDSSQAQSAWNHEENSHVPAGRLNRSQLRSDASKNSLVSGMSIRRAVASEYMILKVLLFAIPASLVKRFNANQTSIDRTFRVNYVFIHFHSMTP
jgi:hypothetical protein